MKITIILIKFLFIGALFILSNNNLYLSSSGDLLEFGNIYYHWIGSVLDTSWEITGQVMKAEWLPQLEIENESLFEDGVNITIDTNSTLPINSSINSSSG